MPAPSSRIRITHYLWVANEQEWDQCYLQNSELRTHCEPEMDKNEVNAACNAGESEIHTACRSEMDKNEVNGAGNA